MATKKPAVDYSALFNQAIAGGPQGTQGGYEAKAMDWLHDVETKGFYSSEGLVPSDSSIEYLQNRLVAAGLLDPKKVKTIGAVDSATLAATASLVKLKEANGFKSGDETLMKLAGGFVGWSNVGQARQPFTAPAFEPLPDDVLREGIIGGLQKAEGRVDDAKLQALTASFRAAEKAHYDQGSAANKAQYEGKASAGTVQQLAEPESFAYADQAGNQESEVYRAAQFGNDLVRFLGGRA